MKHPFFRIGLVPLFLIPLALAGCLSESNPHQEGLEWQHKWVKINSQRDYGQLGYSTGVRACPNDFYSYGVDDFNYLDWNRYEESPQILIDAFDAGIESPGNGCAIMYTSYEYANEVITNLRAEWQRQFPDDEDAERGGTLIPVLYNDTHRLVDSILFITHPPPPDYPVEMRAGTEVADFEMQGVGPLFGEARFHTYDAPAEGAESFQWGRGTNITWVLFEAKWACSEDTCPLDWSIMDDQGTAVDESTAEDFYRVEFFVDEHSVDYDRAWAAMATSEFTMGLNGTAAVTIFQSGDIPEGYSALSSI